MMGIYGNKRPSRGRGRMRETKNALPDVGMKIPNSEEGIKSLSLNLFDCG